MRRRTLWVLDGCLAALCPLLLGSNIPIDKDHDGEPDYVSVSDWDSDGVLEIVDDIQAAIDSLTDTGPKLVVVEPGSYAPPPPRAESILTLPSNLELAGSGEGIAVLNGFDATDLTSTGPVLSNADFDNGNSNITVRDIEINGGWTDGDATGLHHHRMGVFFNRCTNCRVESTMVRDTLHSCLYSKNGTDIHFDANTLLRCGNYSGAGGARYPCVYLFANDGFVQENVYVTNNSCVGVGTSALNTRRESPAAILKNIHFSGNTVENTRVEESYTRRCIEVSGVDGGFYTNNSCVNTGAFMYYSEAYYSDGTYAAASRDIHVEDLRITDPNGSHGLEIHGYLEDATFRNILVQNVDVDYDCMVFNNPLKNVTFEEITFDHCGRMGIYETLPRGSGPTVEEGVTFRRIDILSVDGDRLDGIVRPAVRFRGPARNLTLDELTITDASGNGIEFNGDLSNSTLRNIVVTEVGGHGVAVGPNSVIDTVVISGSAVDGAGSKGFDLQLSPTEPSQALEVSRNSIRDFGRSSPGSATAVGIEISGATSGLDVSENLLEDIGHQGRYGIVHDVWPQPVDASYLCTNSFAGTFLASTKYFVSGLVSAYQDDDDADESVNACDCSPSNPATYPGATEMNDGLDNQCLGYPGYGTIDETSGDSGFHDPSDNTEYSWTAQAGATRYEVIRSTTADFSSDCTTITTSDSHWIDAEEPALGLVFCYLNRPLAPNAGSWGQGSFEAERTIVCP